METLVLVEKIGMVAMVSLNRPQVLNCFTNELLEELTNTLSELERDDGVRALILTGSGRAFCAGGDLEVLKACGTEQQARENMEAANEAMRMLFDLSKPVVAMVNGVAAGAGFNLALACDMIFAAEKATFMQSFIKVGIASDCGGHYLLRKAVGAHLAKELMFTGRPVTAQEGKELGFVNRIYPSETLREETVNFAYELAAAAPLAMAATKRLLNRAEEMSFTQVLEVEKAQQGALLLSQDCKEGIAAFREKRTPVFKAV